MTEKHAKKKRAVVAAAIVAGVLMIASGIGYRAMARHLSGPAGGERLPADALSKLPMIIGEWAGIETPLRQDVVLATDSDSHVSRTYSRGVGNQSVWAYISYGVRVRDMAPHRPEVCYSGAGWLIEQSSDEQIALADGSQLPCRIFHFARGGLSNQKMIVLNYYIVDGQYCPDVSQLRWKFLQGPTAVSYVLQVQIVCTEMANFSTDTTIEAIRGFAAASGEEIFKLLPKTATPTTKEPGGG